MSKRSRKKKKRGRIEEEEGVSSARSRVHIRIQYDALKITEMIVKQLNTKGDQFS